MNAGGLHQLGHPRLAQPALRKARLTASGASSTGVDLADERTKRDPHAIGIMTSPLVVEVV